MTSYAEKIYKGKFKNGFPMKAVDVIHGDVTLVCKRGEHMIQYTKTGQNPIHQTQKITKGTFREVVAKAKKMALSFGENTTMWIHGASENCQYFQVQNGKLVKVM